MMEKTDESAPRRSYYRLSDGFLLEEEGYGSDLFHTYCNVGERSCATTIDHDSSINAVGIDMVEKLELLTTPHPRPYILRRFHDKLNITHKTTVQFSVGKFSCEILCDVIPVPMVSCYLLLGGPWYEENRASYNSLANTYTIKRDNMYVLHPVEKKLFRSWRKERLLKKKETATAIIASSVERKNIVDASLVPHDESLDVDVAATKDDLKPRTVSFEEGEDDMAHPILDITQPDGLATNIYGGEDDVVSLIISVTPISLGQRGGMHHNMQENKQGNLHLFHVREIGWRYSYFSCGDKTGNILISMEDLSNEDAWFNRTRRQTLFLFLFLPIKERGWQGICVREQLSLKSIGWGPPTEDC
jgi:hypothetical protein